ncbi:P-loop containing nucleoside triphosphate hydrolase protein [Leptodontidium sp. 2 PMI_412]|nr:P-loop containing nucleoside triphosphate hydrolase protein [Leptodontidium sp. 2 PMI_412]
MRLLQYNNGGDISLTEFFEGDIPKKYAILSHRWGAQEVTFKDLTDGTSKDKAGYGKIQFCGEQAKRDGLRYFWVDTCCIDKSNAVELQEAINSMFRWYRDATKCYVYLLDVSRPRTNSADASSEAWLIAPTSVNFFSKEGELLGNKVSLERHICEITEIPVNALRGSLLSDFSVTERMSWAASRETYRQEDKAYSLLGIFDVNMPLIYSEGKDKAMQRLREEIEKASKGFKREDFAITFSLSDVPDVEHFVARKAELVEIHKALSGDGSRRTVVLHGLGGIGKTQLAATYTKRHKDSYSAIFWLNINNKDTLKQNYPSATRLSNIDTNQSLDEVVDAVKAWLSLCNNTRWLMIYDNYDNPKLPSKTDPTAVDISKFLPESYQGSIIITTRLSQLVHVRDSLEILLTMSRRHGLTTDPDAVNLTKELDGLPHALATAGVRLMETSPELSSYEDRTLYFTWHISFDNVKQQNPLSADLLCLWAYFNSQDLCFDNTMRVLSNHGLVESKGYSIHGYVHSLAIHALNQDWDYDLAKLAVKCVRAHIPREKDGQPWLIQRRLLQHAARCSYMFSNSLVVDDELADECHSLGVLYAEQGELVEAEQMFQRALQGYKKAIGPDNITTYVPALSTMRYVDMSKSSDLIMLSPRLCGTDYVLWMP